MNGSAILRSCAASPPLAALRCCLYQNQSTIRLHSSATGFPIYRWHHYRLSSVGRGRVRIRRYSTPNLVDMVVEELQLRKKRSEVRAINKLELKSNEGLHENTSRKQVLQRGLLLEFKKDTERVILAVAQKPDGKKNWMVSDQNGIVTSIKPQQVTFIVPGVEDFDHEEISNFILKSQQILDPTLLEFAWIELLEKNKSVTVEELAEMIFGCAEPLESYSAHLLLSMDDIYFTSETKGSVSVYAPRSVVQVEELTRRKLAKEAAEKEFDEFVVSLKSARSMPLNAKPPISTWLSEEKNRKKIESLRAYALDNCWNEDEKRTVGMVNLSDSPVWCHLLQN